MASQQPKLNDRDATAPGFGDCETMHDLTSLVQWASLAGIPASTSPRYDRMFC